jgi:hypothetical protein
MELGLPIEPFFMGNVLVQAKEIGSENCEFVYQNALQFGDSTIQ